MENIKQLLQEILNYNKMDCVLDLLLLMDFNIIDNTYYIEFNYDIKIALTEKDIVITQDEFVLTVPDEYIAIDTFMKFIFKK